MLQANGLPANPTAAETIPLESAELKVAGPPVPIRIQYAAIKELHSTTNLGGVIGLLLGPSIQQRISIEHCEPLAGDSDKPLAKPDQYRKAVGQLITATLQGSPEQASKFLGFFRTQSAGWLELSDLDREMAKRFLPSSGGLFLLIRTSEHRPWSAALFSSDSNVFPKSLAPALQFPFDEYLLRNGYSADSLPATLEAQPSLRPGIVIPRPPILWVAIAAGFVLILFLGIALFRSHPPAPAAPVEASAPTHSGPLGLQVSRAGSDFEISWDRFATAIQRAQTGVLSIQDGDMSRNLYLAPDQLREGRIIYSSVSPNLDFRLAVTHDNDTEAESVELLRADNLAPSSGVSARLRTRNSQPLILNKSPSDNGADSAPPAAPSEPAPPDSASQPQGPKRFQVPAPLIVAQALPAVTIPAPPAPPDVAPPGVPTDLLQSTGAPAPLPPPQAVTNPNPKQTLEVSRYVEPRPLARVNPSISAQARAAIKESAEVVVTVTLDNTGKVTSARADQVTGVTNQYFRSYFEKVASDAAENWNFTPGILNGKRVASEFSLHFVFKP